jgi:Predicted acetyltransferase
LSALLKPELLTAAHDPSGFDCGEPALNTWLAKYALSSQRAELAKSYVTHAGDDVIKGYYTLSAGGVSPEEAPVRVASGGGRHSVPVILLARLAVDVAFQGQGVGRSLVRDALIRIATAGDIIGVRAVLVHMKSPDLRTFYATLGFESSPVDDLQMMLLMKDLRASVRAQEELGTYQPNGGL